MTTPIKVKSRHTDNTAPTTNDLTVAGECATNTVSKKLYTRDASDNIVLIGIQDGTGDGNLLVWNNTSGVWVETTGFTINPSTGAMSINALPGITLNDLATSDPVSAGALWNDSGTLKVSAG